ncbi:MAG: segregation/condensation protein A [Patescibacteria group bacterium]|nr:segregation/condensation protein A [Patescibacteria group bacterium]
MLKVQLDQFNGPLDLLLSLIKKEKLDITQISLVKITDQYLSYVEEFKNVATDEVADFLLVAAKLVFIKSKALLPKEEEEDDEEEELLRQLKIYKQYFEACKKINKIILEENFLFTRDSKIKNQVVFSPPKNLKTSILHKSFKNFLHNLKKDDFIIDRDKIMRKISISDRIKEIHSIIKDRKEFILNQSIVSWVFKSERIVSFLAVLELNNRQDIFIKQDELFADIVISNV